MARALFTASRKERPTSPEEILMALMLREEGSSARRLVNRLLQPWEMEQVISQIERHAATESRNLHAQSGLTAFDSTTKRHSPPEEFFLHLAEDLRQNHHEQEEVGTAEALIHLMGNSTSFCTKTLGHYGIDRQLLENEYHKALAEKNGDEDSDSEYTANAEGSPRKVFRSETDFDTEGLPALQSESDPLAPYGTDLTREARQGKIDPVVGRDREIERVIRILTRRRKNNPLLVGDAGVGKSAIVEGLALRIVRGEVPQTLQGKRLFSLDLTALVAGTKFRGEFEERLQQVVENLRLQKETLLFIDEVHMLTGAGATQGSLDAANILKPLLARGELATIGATTHEEYRRYIESDAALARRFQPVRVEPTDRNATLEILRHLRPHYERHHGVRYTDEALEACLELGERYLGERHFPDKAIDLLDEAGAARQTSLSRTRPLIGREAIARTVTEMTGIPIRHFGTERGELLRRLPHHLNQRVVGQTEAVERITRALQRTHSGMHEANRPLGVFFFVGPTGVGKSLMAKEVANCLFGEEKNPYGGVIRLDMSDYGERHTAARLFGAPPGYVGYGKGGELSEAVRRRPHSVVLFDEIEKAHPALFDALMPLLEEGVVTDASGRRIDFRHTLLIFTSNAGAVSKQGPSIGFAKTTMQESSREQERLHRRAIEALFRPEFFNRIDEVICFKPLSPQAMLLLVEREVKRLCARAAEAGHTLRITPGVQRLLAQTGFDARHGARALKRTLRRHLEEPLAQWLVEQCPKAGCEAVAALNRKGEIHWRIKAKT